MLQLGAQPAIAGDGASDIEAVRRVGGFFGGSVGAKPQFQHQPGVLQQKGAQLRAVGFAFAQADEERFEVSVLGMGTRATLVARCVLLIDLVPIEEGKESAVVLHHGVGFTQTGQRILVKGRRFCYHKGKLLVFRVG